MTRIAPSLFRYLPAPSITVLGFVFVLCTPSGVRAGDHYVSLLEIFPSGKCSPVAPNFELMVSRFAGGEITEYRIRDDQGEVVETITTLVNQAYDQWVIVGSKRDEKVIFCLYASGIGDSSVARRAID